MIPNKIKNAAIITLALGIGIGVPLMSRFKGGEFRDSVMQGAQIALSDSITPAPPGQTASGLSQSGGSSQASTAQVLSCSADPPVVYAGDKVKWTAAFTNVSNASSLNYLWFDGVTGTGQTIQKSYDKAGTYQARLALSDPDYSSKSATCSVTVLDKSQIAPTPPGQTAGGDTSGSSGSSSDSQQAGGLAPLNDILSCKIINPTIVLSQQQISIMRCQLTPPALVTGWIIKGDYTPPKDPAPETIMKTLVYKNSVYDKIFSLNWNGINNYDTPVDEGNYTFVVEAQATQNSTPDISIQKLKVVQNPTVDTQQSTQQTQEQGLGQTFSPQPSETQGTTTEQTPPALNQETQQSTQQTAQNSSQTSKCPGVNYPNDIENHWAKIVILEAYDSCIFKGYQDGSFHPDQPVSRAEALKALMFAAGIPPKVGCYTTDCGSPFKDLDFWQGQWVRAAYDLKMIKGATFDKFEGSRAITRGEAVVMAGRIFKVPAFKGCYTANCGAGYPNNFFMDIKDANQGPYLRSFWELHIITGTGTNTFSPDRAMTRAELAKLIARIKEAEAPATPPASTAPASAVGTSQAATAQ